MTLPKNITRLVDDYRQAVEEDYSDGLGGTASPRTMAVRAALEAAIAKEIQPVEPPTDAEAEAWRKIARPSPEHHGFVLLDPSEVEQAVALMRRARARDAEVRALVAKDKAAFLRLFDQDVEVEADRAMIEKASKCLSRVCADQGFKLSACIPARPGVDDDLVIADGLEAGMRAVRRARATGSLERLRERVQKSLRDIEANANRFDAMAAVGLGNEVLRWIDESQQEAKR